MTYSVPDQLIIALDGKLSSNTYFTNRIIMANKEEETPQWQSVFRSTLFCNKIALVTGGGSGIGRSIAIELASVGATVVIASRDEDKCMAAAKEMNDEIQQLHTKNKGVGSRCGGRVVVGPSTSIRDEEQVNNLVSSPKLIIFCS